MKQKKKEPLTPTRAAIHLILFFLILITLLVLVFRYDNGWIQLITVLAMVVECGYWIYRGINKLMGG